MADLVDWLGGRSTPATWRPRWPSASSPTAPRCSTGSCSRSPPSTTLDDDTLVERRGEHGGGAARSTSPATSSDSCSATASSCCPPRSSPRCAACSTATSRPVGELADMLDQPSRLVLVRRLVREGALRTAPPTMGKRSRLELRCATESLARDEPLIGTASRVRRWMVVEQPGAWGRDALTETPPAPPRSPRALVAHARSHRVRVAAGPPARRHARTTATGRVFLAHTGAERRWIEQLVRAGRPARSACSTSSSGPLAFPDPPGIGEPGPDGLALVCTNGRHDPCCADKGRPVVRALAAAGRGRRVGVVARRRRPVRRQRRRACPTASTTAASQPDEAAGAGRRPPGRHDRPRPLPRAQPPAPAGAGGRPVRPAAPGRDPGRRA